MKRTIAIVAGILLSFSIAVAQTPETPTPPTTTAPPANTWEASKNPTVDSIAAKYKDKIVAVPVAPGIEKIFPVLGKYETTTNTADAPAVSISLDAQNKGIIWVDGLPQGRVKALLTKSPSTYKIPAQKTEDGKDIAEGTLIYDRDLNTLSIAIGKKYDAADPASVFAAPAVVEEPAPATTTKTKSKTKVKAKKEAPKPWVYTGTKTEVATVTTEVIK
jgi:hypothetical protein